VLILKKLAAPQRKKQTTKEQLNRSSETREVAFIMYFSNKFKLTFRYAIGSLSF